MTNQNDEIRERVKKDLNKWKPYHAPLLLVGITPNTRETWEKGTNEKVAIVFTSLIISSFTIILPSLLILGISISRVCVAGNKDYENSSGLCAGNGRKEDDKRKKEYEQQKLNEERKTKEEKNKKLNEWYNEISSYSCERTLKENLRNPNSYERDGDFITTSDDGNKKVVIWKFRAENGFGGMNISAAMCNIFKSNGGEYQVKQISG